MLLGPMLLGPDQDQDQDCVVPHVAGECVPCLLDWCWRDTEQAITTAMHAGALDVVTFHYCKIVILSRFARCPSR